MEDTQKKLDKALKRNLDVQQKVEVTSNKEPSTDLSDEESVPDNENNIE